MTEPSKSAKPDDVSQTAWDATNAIGETVYGRHERGFVMWPLVDSVAMRPAIARAIDAATKAENEVIAVLCETHVETVGRGNSRRLEQVDVTANGSVHAGMSYAAAIRKRGE